MGAVCSSTPPHLHLHLHLTLTLPTSPTQPSLPLPRCQSANLHLLFASLLPEVPSPIKHFIWTCIVPPSCLLLRSSLLILFIQHSHPYAHPCVFLQKGEVS